MPTRLLEATLPSDRLDEVPGIIDKADIWTVDDSHRSGVIGTEGDTAMVRLLLDARDSEAVTDALMHAFGHLDTFRIVLLPVEATLPRLEEPGKESGGTERNGEASGDAEREGEEPAKKAPSRISREELYEDIAEASRLDKIYMMLVILSTLVAAIGLARGDVAVVIGAMLIAPLLGPNIALALAAAMGDPDLGGRALKTNAAGLGTALALSMVLGLVLTIDPTEPQLANRTVVNAGDILIALSAGAAGSLAFTSGVPAVVVGVMVAVALLPPLVAVGLLVGAGHPELALGALVLLVTNVTCVNLSAIATFYLQKVRPRTWWEADRARKATHRAAAAWVVLLILLAVLIWRFM
ncbi:MAG: TIGR00341 family protein [Rhodothermales bacterium]